MKRADITMKDVFVSWTGKDRELKETIVQFLNSNGISCLESDESCSGDYREWSKEAVGACSVFLLILTENTLQSQYVPIEIEELKKLDDWENRVVPVCMSMELYQKHSWGLHESESAVILGDQFPTQQHLTAILHKMIDLLIHRQHAIYCNQSNKGHVTLMPLLGANKTATKQYSYDSLYIPRSVTELDDQGQHIEAIESPNELIKNDDILFISGPAGSGKTQYIHQIRKCANDNDLVISLSCAKIAQSSENLLGFMYHEFERIAGIRTFYSIDNFKRLLNIKHLVLILDGMDEIATYAGTQKFVKKVDEFYASNGENVTLIFTSRNSDDANTIALGAKAIRRFVLNHLTDSQISKLSENLFLLFGSAERNNEFFIKLNDLDEEIRSNPLLLSQLAIVYQTTGDMPQSIVGIYDAISKITFNVDLSTEFDSVPDNYKEMLELELSSILKSFSQERYRLLSQGKNTEITKIFSKILKEKYASESKHRAEFLVEYLQNRTILIDGEFYHKMFLEYFTAVAYYEQAFNDYDEIENVGILKELFAHYTDVYWSAVIKLFLVKADSCIDEGTTEELYDSILKYNEICEYTLLFDTCRDLIRHKEKAQLGLVRDILSKSVSGAYPPYGPLFWYVPEYELYETAVLAAEKLFGNAKALALVRDVCFIFGMKYTIADITNKVDGQQLYQAVKPMLSGVREGLVELFCTGKTDCMLGTDIYPRCFNITEVRHWKDFGCGIFGRMPNAFEDELGLYFHEMFSELGGEYIGIVAAPFDRERLERILPQKSCRKLCGLFFSPTVDQSFAWLAVNVNHLRRVYAPENTQRVSSYKSRFEKWTQIHGIYLSDDGLLYFNNTVSLPDDVTVIKAGGFSYCLTLESIVIPDSVKIIEERAFLHCNSLMSITIPDGVTEIREGTFWDCRSITSITLPNSVTKIESHAFHGCNSLVAITLPESLKEIGYSAFEGCHSLTSIEIPNSVTKIGNGAFYECHALSAITLPEALTTIGYAAFRFCRALESVTIPNNVIEIGKDAFANTAIKRINNCPPGYTKKELRVSENCRIFYRTLKMDETVFKVLDGVVEINREDVPNRRVLRKVILPNSVTTIGMHTFEYCCDLESITIPDGITSIEAFTFHECHALKSITLHSNITEIKYSAFMRCYALSTITIPNSVTVIDGALFRECYSLESIEIPDSVTIIGSYAFCSCRSLKSITIPDGVIELRQSAFSGCRALELIVIPNSVKKLERYAFSGCYSLKSIVIPDSVARVEHNAFEFCKSLSEVTISNGVRIIEDDAFRYCEALSSITFPDSVTTIGNNVFKGCSALKRIYNCPPGYTAEELGAPDDCVIEMRPMREGEDIFEISEGTSVVNEYDIPNRRVLRTVIVPISVTKIGYKAFYDYGALESIAIPNDVTEIQGLAFEGCTSLKSIVLPNSVTKIGWGAFRRCKSLKSILIPSSVTEITTCVFEECSALSSITIPNSVSIIEEDAFKNCSNLTSVSLSASVKRISSKAFTGCTGIKEITISRRFEDELLHIFSSVDLSQVTIHWL